MRKLLTVLAAIGVLSTMFVGAAGAQTVQDWWVQIRAGSNVGFSPLNSGHSTLVAGVRPTATDGFDTGLDGNTAVGPPPPSDTGAKAAWYRGDWTDTFARFDYKAPLAVLPTNVVPKVWTDLLVWAGVDYQFDKIYVTFFTTTTRQAPLSIDGKKVAYKVQMTYAPAGYSGPTSWIFENYGEVSGSNIMLGSVEWPVIPGVKVANPISGTGPLAATQVGGYRFNFVTPEPGSMLVLASGITGLMGLIARRRSA